MGHSSPAGFETVLELLGPIFDAIHEASHTLKIVDSLNSVKPKPKLTSLKPPLCRSRWPLFIKNSSLLFPCWVPKIPCSFE
jgi:hypothetical protein